MTLSPTTQSPPAFASRLPPSLASLGGAASGQILGDSLMARDAKGAHVLQRALAATLDHRDDVIGVPVAGAAKVPAELLPELGPFTPLFGRDSQFDPLP